MRSTAMPTVSYKAEALALCDIEPIGSWAAATSHPAGCSRSVAQPAGRSALIVVILAHVGTEEAKSLCQSGSWTQMFLPLMQKRPGEFLPSIASGCVFHTMVAGLISLAAGRVPCLDFHRAVGSQCFFQVAAAPSRHPRQAAQP